ncbi:YfbM family protein [Paenibacillus glycinis]|uniref:DUF1877 family protein n=1 Tax=Paenibacillus glycinis TaxID=2697035 RepID=A0ABW9XRS0_9BACL|nr:YfbM family protein [Paenibacillus glycinis]NBD25357.1 DUF1877 family protein [Paenibacillus glycinis]
MSMVLHLMQVNPEDLDAFMDNPHLAEEYANVENESHASLYLDKSWHAIHFLLNGSGSRDEPLVHALLGGESLVEDYYNGPLRYITDDQVGAISRELARFNGNLLTDRYDPEQMAKEEIYPALDWDNPDTRQYVFDYFWDVVDFYTHAHGAGNGMLMYMT